MQPTHPLFSVATPMHAFPAQPLPAIVQSTHDPPYTHLPGCLRARPPHACGTHLAPRAPPPPPALAAAAAAAEPRGTPQARIAGGSTGPSSMADTGAVFGHAVALRALGGPASVSGVAVAVVVVVVVVVIVVVVVVVVAVAVSPPEEEEVKLVLHLPAPRRGHPHQKAKDRTSTVQSACSFARLSAAFHPLKLLFPHFLFHPAAVEPCVLLSWFSLLPARPPGAHGVELPRSDWPGRTRPCPSRAMGSPPPLPAPEEAPPQTEAQAAVQAASAQAVVQAASAQAVVRAAPAQQASLAAAPDTRISRPLVASNKGWWLPSSAKSAAATAAEVAGV